MDEVLRVVIHALTGTAALAALLFVGIYTRSPWRGNVTGRNTMAFMVVVAAVLVVAVISRAFNATLPPWVAVLVWAIINWPMWWRVWILWMAQHKNYDPKLPPHSCVHCGQRCVGV